MFRPLQYYVNTTDTSTRAITTARSGLYPSAIANEVSPERLCRFFDETTDGYKIGKSVRKLCSFARHDLFADPPFSRIDLVVCRTLLSHIKLTWRQRVLASLHYALKPSGFLLLGLLEPDANLRQMLALKNKKRKLYRRLPGSLVRNWSALQPSQGRNEARQSAVQREENARELQGAVESLASLNEELCSVNDELVASQKQLQASHDELTRSRHHVLEINHALRAAYEKAEAAIRAKDEFVAVISHELRSPLTSILGYVRLLREADDTLHREQFLSVIERNGKAQLQIIEDLLDTARIAGGKLKLDVQPADLTAVIIDALDVVRPAAQAKSIELRHLLEPVDQISGDRDRLQQVVWNLLSNAIKFTPPGGRVEITLRQVAPFIEIVVRDSGNGIDPEFLPHIFERFRQSDMSS